MHRHLPCFMLTSRCYQFNVSEDQRNGGHGILAISTKILTQQNLDPLQRGQKHINWEGEEKPTTPCNAGISRTRSGYLKPSFPSNPLLFQGHTYFTPSSMHALHTVTLEAFMVLFEIYDCEPQWESAFPETKDDGARNVPWKKVEEKGVSGLMSASRFALVRNRGRILYMKITIVLIRHAGIFNPTDLKEVYGWWSVKGTIPITICTCPESRTDIIHEVLTYIYSSAMPTSRRYIRVKVLYPSRFALVRNPGRIRCIHETT